MVVLANGGLLGHLDSFCFYCGRSVRVWKQEMYATPPPDMRTKDHVVPQSKGGKKTVVACRSCNDEKRDMTLDEYRLIRAFRAGMIQLPEYKFAAEQRI
jgi:5-methylcytosine-specific restriction endonuclease McrA